MNDNWRYTAFSVTKYNPVFRNEKGHYMKHAWIGFGQIGEIFEGEVLTLDSYLQTESKYIKAACYFFQFHKCNSIVIKNLEKRHTDDYFLADKEELVTFFNKINEGATIELDDLSLLVKLTLRDMLWGEFFCTNNDEVALRFGYDFYMYFNSNLDMNDLIVKVGQLGLYVW
jgi:hypothetical protein